MAAIASAFAWQVHRGLRLETNILALLPATEQDPVVELAVRGFVDQVARREVFLVSGQDFTQSTVEAGLLVASLSRSGLYERLDYRVDTTLQQAYYDFYFPHRYALLTPAARAQLALPGGAVRWLSAREERLYAPMASMYTRLLATDPLQLFPDWLQGLPQFGGAVQPRDGFLVTTGTGGREYVVVSAVTRGSPFDRDAQAPLAQAQEHALAELQRAQPGVQVLQSGMLRYAHLAASTAEREASRIGFGSTLGVLLLMLLVFRSLRQLLLSLLPISAGILAGFTVTYLIFPHFHLLTLSFGVSIIGVCDDYAMRYFTEKLADKQWTPERGLVAVLPAIALGATTSIMSYLGLIVAPFPGLRQMAVFATVGLLVSFLTVCCCFPLLISRRPPRPTRFLSWAGAWLRRCERLPRGPAAWALGGVALLVVATGLWRLRADDDIRLLQHSPPAWVSEDETVRALLGDPDGSRFFLVEGANADTVLAREQALLARLSDLQATGALRQAIGVSSMLPAQVQQVDDQAALQHALLAATPSPLDDFATHLGLPPATTAALVQDLQQPVPPATIADWLASPISAPLRTLWLGRTASGYAGVVALAGVRDTAAVAGLAQELAGVHFIDKVADTSRLLARYRHMAIGLVALAYAFILGLLAWRYGWRRGAQVIVPPTLAVLLTLAMLGWVGFPLNLFSTLALLLVLGLGSDFTIFLAEGGARRDAPALAIILSAITTLLAFGLLALSTTPVLHSFGAAMLLGITAALLLAPLGRPRDQHTEPGGPP